MSIKFLSLPLLGLALALFISAPIKVYGLGWTIKTSYMKKPFILHGPMPSIEEVAQYIKAKEPTRDQTTLSNNELAQAILHTAQCIEIDPYIFVGLIRRESSFNEKTVSTSDARGLTQLIPKGFQEVNDQLGMRGCGPLAFEGEIRDVKTSAKAYANCTNVEVFIDYIEKCSPYAYNHLYTGLDETKDYKDQMKDRISQDPILQLTYGALYLRVMLAKANESGHEGRNMFEQAAQNYNGDPKKMVGFSIDVLEYALDLKSTIDTDIERYDIQIPALEKKFPFVIKEQDKIKLSPSDDDTIGIHIVGTIASDDGSVRNLPMRVGPPTSEGLAGLAPAKVLRSPERPHAFFLFPGTKVKVLEVKELEKGPWAKVTLVDEQDYDYYNVDANSPLWVDKNFLLKEESKATETPRVR